MCFFKKKTTLPVVSLSKLPWEELEDTLAGMGISLILTQKPDDFVQYTSELEWRKVLPYLTISAEYAVNGADCDDYARKASVDASILFGLSGCLECWGDTPMGYHAFNLVILSPHSFALFESNAGFEWAGSLFQIGENGYSPKGWKS